MVPMASGDDSYGQGSAHPTLSEGVMEAALGLTGAAIHM